MGLNTEKLKKHQEERAAERDEIFGKSFYNLQDGKNVLRILPRSLAYFSKDGDDDYAVRYFVHYKMFEVEGYKMIVCRKSFGETCPICEMLAGLDDKTRVGRQRAKERYMYNVYDPQDGLIKILETGPMIYEEIFKYVINDEWGDLFSVKEGRMITIEKISAEKTGTGYVDYTVVPSPDKKDISEALPEGWDETIDKLADSLPPVLKVEELVDLAKLYEEGKAPEVKEGGGKTASGKTAESASEKKAPPKTSTPACYGKEYKPREEKCKSCEHKDACRAEYLKM